MIILLKISYMKVFWNLKVGINSISISNMEMILNNHVNIIFKSKKFKKFWKRDKKKKERFLHRNKNHHIILYNQLYLINEINKKEFLKVGSQINW